jgi:hypothetical protein
VKSGSDAVKQLVNMSRPLIMTGGLSTARCILRQLTDADCVKELDDRYLFVELKVLSEKYC